jgi:hypothetical protein
MKLRILVSVAASLLLLGGLISVSDHAQAQDFDFGQIDKFELLGTGTLHVGSSPDGRPLSFEWRGSARRERSTTRRFAKSADEESGNGSRAPNWPSDSHRFGQTTQ